MDEYRKFGSTSNIVRFALRHAITGQGLTGLTSGSSGLIISTIADAEASATTYTVGSSNVESITTLATFAAPTSGKCRFKEVDATNFKGLYEFQFADARFAVSNARALRISVTGATNLLDAHWRIGLVQFDPFDSVRMGMTALPNAAAEAAGGLYTRGTGAGQINQANNGQIDVNTLRQNGTTLTARDIGASVLLSSGTGTGQVSLSSGAVTVGTNNDKTGYGLSAAAVQAIWDALTSALTTAGSIGKKLADWILGSDSKVLLSTNAQTGVTIPTVTTVSNRVTANTDQLAGSSNAATRLGASATGIYSGSITGASPTTTTLVDSALGGKADDFYKNRVLLFTSGNQQYQLAQVTGYTGSSNTLTFTTLTGAPAQNDTYVLL